MGRRGEGEERKTGWDEAGEERKKGWGEGGRVKRGRRGGERGGG